jgi:hypothetical protein
MQSRIEFWPEQDQTSIIIGISLFVLLFIILIVGAVAAGKRKGGGSPAARRRYNKYVFHRMATNIGLNKEQVQILDNLIRICKVRQPFLLFSNAGLLDDVLKKGLYSVSNNKELSEVDKDRRFKSFYKIKEIIERNSRRGVGITSTNLVRPGQPVVLSFPDSSQLQTKVLTNLKRMLVCLIPDEVGSDRLKWQKGTNLKAHFWRDNDSGYMFSSKILGYDHIKGKPAVLIQHSRTLKRNQQRKFRRRPLARSCFFYPIEVVTVGRGRHAKKRAYVQQNFKHLGNFIDISAGGCSINSQSPLDRSRLLMIEFEIERGERITAYGKVRRVTQNKGLFNVMHIMFTKLTSHNLNSIYSYVYNYVKSPPGPPSRYRLTKTGNYNTMAR